MQNTLPLSSKANSKPSAHQVIRAMAASFLRPLLPPKPFLSARRPHLAAAPATSTATLPLRPQTSPHLALRRLGRLGVDWEATAWTASSAARGRRRRRRAGDGGAREKAAAASHPRAEESAVSIPERRNRGRRGAGEAEPSSSPADLGDRAREEEGLHSSFAADADAEDNRSIAVVSLAADHEQFPPARAASAHRSLHLPLVLKA